MHLKLPRLIKVLGSIGLYGLAAFFMLLQAEGYRIDWQAGKLAATSSLVLPAVRPELAEVWVDGTRRSQGTAAVHGLSVGLHTVSLVASGYQPWHKAVFLQAGMVENLGEINLVPQAVTVRPVLPQSQAIYTNPRTSYSLVKEEGRWLLVDLSLSPPRRFQLQSDTMDDIVSVAWSPLASRALLRSVDQSGEPKLILISLVSLQSVSLPALRYWQQLTWVGEERFLGLEDGQVYLFDLLTQEKKQLAEGVKSFTWHDEKLVLLTAKGIGERRLTNARLQPLTNAILPAATAVLQHYGPWLVAAEQNSQQKVVWLTPEKWQLLAADLIAQADQDLLLVNGLELWQWRSAAARPDFLTRFSTSPTALLGMPSGRVLVVAGKELYLVDRGYGLAYQVGQCAGHLQEYQGLPYCQTSQGLYRLDL